MDDMELNEIRSGYNQHVHRVALHIIGKGIAKNYLTALGFGYEKILEQTVEQIKNNSRGDLGEIARQVEKRKKMLAAEKVILKEHLDDYDARVSEFEGSARAQIQDNYSKKSIDKAIAEIMGKKRNDEKGHGYDPFNLGMDKNNCITDSFSIILDKKAREP